MNQNILSIFWKKNFGKFFWTSPENYLDKSRKFSARRTCTYFIYWKMTSTSVVSSTSNIFFHFLIDDSAVYSIQSTLYTYSTAVFQIISSS